MKKVLSSFMTVLLALTLCACHNKTPAELERNITRNVIQSKYLSGAVNGSLQLDLDSMGNQSFNLDGNFIADTTTGAPHFKLDSSVSLQNLLSLPLSVAIDDNSMNTTIFGKTSSHSFDEERKASLRTLVQMLEVEQTNLKRTVTETSIDGKKALEIHYDTEQINAMLQNGGHSASLQQLTMFYLLNDNNQPEEIRVQLKMTYNKPFEVNLKLTSLSIGKNE